MRHLKNLTLLAIAAFFGSYLFGAFFEVNFLISEWSPDTRQGVIIGSCISFAIGGIVYGMSTAPNP